MIKYSKITLKSGFVLPYRFIGSTVRGAFGHGLKKVVCINPSGVCEGCFAKEECLFYDFFENKSPKYRLKIDLSGNVSFDLFLFEEYAKKSPYVVSALYKAFKQIGIGKHKQKIDFKMFYNDKLIFDGADFKEFNNEVKEYGVKDIKSQCRLVFVTPIRIKENNRFVREKIKPETVLRSIHHKINKLQNIPLSRLPFKPKYKISDEKFSFNELRRYSNRQKRGMNFGGITGYIDFEYIDEKSYYLLKIGELVGVGKQTTFGLGSIEIM